MREQLIKEVEIIPLEVVVRNVAAGSLAKRLGIEEGTQLPRSIIEFYYKNDALGDPMVSEEHITAFGWATPAGDRRHHGAGHPRQRLPLRPVPGRRHPARRLQDRVRPALRERHDAHRRSPTRSRPIPAGCGTSRPDKLDKDRFRRDIGGLVEAYQEVARRLGVLTETPRPRGQGPVLVASNPPAKGKPTPALDETPVPNGKPN
jgi:phosphoribosylaminoimidazole-succinocarboxamide synthase